MLHTKAKLQMFIKNRIEWEQDKAEGVTLLEHIGPIH